MGRWWIVAGVVGALFMSGCGASVSVSAGVIPNDGAYLAAWRTGWTAVERASARIHFRGLTLRMHSLEAGDYAEAERDEWFTESKTLMAESNALAQKAYRSFPRWARPNPAPTI